MVRLMVVTFGFLAWAFYMMSGGADFDPQRAGLDSARHDPLATTEAPEPAAAASHAEGIQVTRVSLDLTSVEDVPTGDADTRTASTSPPQSLPQIQSALATDDTRIIPSLVENATPEGEHSETGATAADLAAETVSLDTDADVRVVSGSRVNVRTGPGTSHGVVDTLVRGEEVEVLDDSGSGWLRIRATDAGTVGWMAASLLTNG